MIRQKILMFSPSGHKTSMDVRVRNRIRFIVSCVRKCVWIVIVYFVCVHVASPSAELVKRVRELYTRNSSDVRFLIPVLHGLQKVGSLSHYQETTVDREIFMLKNNLR